MNKWNRCKVLLSGCVGLMIGTIGLVPTGEARATFSSFYLVEGVQIVPVLIGMFVIAELLLLVGRDYVVDQEKNSVSRSFGQILRGGKSALRFPFNIGRSSLVGIIIGLIPAAGATLAALTSYTIAKKSSKDPESFGKGNPQGVVAAEAANNACSGGALMTTLVLGVPGSVATAVLLGALTLHGLRAGPQLINQQSTIVYGLIFAAIAAQILMVAIAGVVGYTFSGALAIRTRVLVPVLFIFSTLGTYAVRNATFDVFLMLGFGVLGYFMKRHGYLPVAVVMGAMLGAIADNEFVRVLQLFGSRWYMAFVERPIALGLLVVLVAIVARSIYQGVKPAKKSAES